MKLGNSNRKRRQFIRMKLVVSVLYIMHVSA